MPFPKRLSKQESAADAARRAGMAGIGEARETLSTARPSLLTPPGADEPIVMPELRLEGPPGLPRTPPPASPARPLPSAADIMPEWVPSLRLRPELSPAASSATPAVAPPPRQEAATTQPEGLEANPYSSLPENPYTELSSPPNARGAVPSVRVPPRLTAGGEEIVDDEEIPSRPAPLRTEAPESGRGLAPPNPKAMAGMFGPSAKEQGRIDAARGEDDAIRRRQRIARGVLGAVGMFGALAGSQGLAGLGMAGSAVARGVGRDTDNEERARTDVNRDIASRGAERQYGDQQAAQAAQREQQAAEAARQGRLDEANLGLTAARTAGAQADAAQSEFERSLAVGDQAGAREMYRSMVNGMNDDSGFVQEQRRLIASPEFATASAQTLREGMARLTQLANNRRAGLLESGGGHGGGTRMVQDPNTLAMHQVRTGGGSRGPSQPAGAPTAPTEGFWFMPAGAAPSAGAGRRARVEPPAAPPNAAPATDSGPASIPVASAIAQTFQDLTPDERTIALRSAMEHNFTPERLRDGRGQTVINAAISAYRGAGAHDRTAMLARAEDVIAHDLTSEGVGSDISDPRDYGRRAVRMSDIYDQHIARYDSASARVRDAVANGMTPTDWASVITGDNGNVSAAFRNYRGLNNLRSAIRDLREDYGRARSGAAVHDAEWSNFSGILGMDEVWTSPDNFRNAMSRLSGVGRSRLAAEAGSGTNDAAAVMNNWRAQQRRARLGGGR